MSRRLGAAALALVALLPACEFRGVSSLPLPGAVAAGDDTYQVLVQFEDVLDLVPYSAVKVQNATVGHVVEVRLADGHAEVLCQLKDSVDLPKNAVGRVAETSLLGEKFVSLDPPTDEPPQGELLHGDVVTLARTSTGATVEELLASLSLVLNGGGLEHVRTITVELNKALGGREDAVRSVLEQLDVLVAGLEQQKADIVRALEGIERLTGTLREQQDLLVDAVEQLPPALEVLVEQREGLTRMLTALGELGTVGTRVIESSRDDLLANLRDLQPTLTQLAVAAEDIPKSLDISPIYPFAKGTPNVFHGDFGNIWLTIDLDPTELARSLGPDGAPPLPLPPADREDVPDVVELLLGGMR